jgi:hypothetical protein
MTIGDFKQNILNKMLSHEKIHLNTEDKTAIWESFKLEPET